MLSLTQCRKCKLKWQWDPVFIYQLGKYVLIHTVLLNQYPLSSMAGGSLNWCYSHVWKKNTHTQTYTNMVMHTWTWSLSLPSPNSPTWALVTVPASGQGTMWWLPGYTSRKMTFTVSLLYCLEISQVHGLHSQWFSKVVKKRKELLLRR